MANNADSLEIQRVQLELLEKAIKQYEDGGDPPAAIQTLEAAVAKGPNSIHVPLLLLHKGAFLSATGDYDEATTIADQCKLVYPRRAEGHYLGAMVLADEDRIQEAIDAFKVARSMNEELGDLVTIVKQRMSDLAVQIRDMRHQRLRDALADHGKRYNTYATPKCPKCEATFDKPTPQWLCTKCFADGKEVQVWEPDEASGRCCHCNETVGFMGRHHCRCCGKLVCSSCSPDKQRLPLLGFATPQRVCTQCSAKLKVHRGQLPQGADDPYAEAARDDP